MLKFSCHVICSACFEALFWFVIFLAWSKSILCGIIFLAYFKALLRCVILPACFEVIFCPIILPACAQNLSFSVLSHWCVQILLSVKWSLSVSILHSLLPFFPLNFLAFSYYFRVTFPTKPVIWNTVQWSTRSKSRFDQHTVCFHSAASPSLLPSPLRMAEMCGGLSPEAACTMMVSSHSLPQIWLNHVVQHLHCRIPENIPGCINQLCLIILQFLQWCACNKLIALYVPLLEGEP